MGRSRLKVPTVRNFVAKNLKTSGSGTHRDKKKDYNRQDFKLAKDR